MFGYCTERQDFRVFKLNRLWELSLTGNAFHPREIPPDRLELGGSLVDTNEVQVLFDPSVRYRLIEDFGFRSFIETGDGRLLFSVGYTNKDYILSWILAFGDKAKVISPPELAAEIKMIAGNIIENYKRT